MKKKLASRIQSLLLICLLILAMIPWHTSDAATLTTSSDYLSRLTENLTSGEAHEIQITPATAVSGGVGTNKLILVFPDGDDGKWCYTAGTDLATSTTSLRNSATALPGTLTARCVQGAGASSYDTLYIEGVNNLTAGTLYAVKVSDGTTGKLGTPANTTGGVITVKTNNGTSDVDTASIQEDIIASDQISVTGKVDPVITFAISDNSVGFGSIASGAARWASGDLLGSATEPANTLPVQLTLTTNGDDGAVIEIKDTNPNSASGLYSVDNTTTLTSRASTVVAAGTEGFGIYGKNATTLTIAEAFDNDSTSDAAISTTFQTFASVSGPTSANATVDVALKAAIAVNTPAGDYADTVTVVATGKF